MHQITIKKRTTMVTGLLAASLVALVLTASGSVAPAGAVTPSQLEKHGWTCITAEPVTDQLHCAKSRGLALMFSGEARTLKMLVFDSSGETYLGTELNVHGDIFAGQPCPTDPPTYEYTHLLPVFGIDYWACHRFNSDHL
jgi:hypothetical protein